MKKYIQLFKEKNLIYLFLGVLFSNFGQSMAVITIIWTVYAKTNNPLLIAISLICLELPVILIGPLLGNLLDKYRVKTMVNYANLSRGLLFLLLIIFPLTTTINYIIFFTLIVISSSLVPISKSGDIILVRKITNKDNRVLVNSAMNILFDLSNIFGALAGGVVLAIGIGNNVFLINALFLILSAIFYYFITEAKVVNNNNDNNLVNVKSWFDEFLGGLKYIFGNKIILSITMVSFFWNFLIWGTAPTLTPIFTLNVLEAGPNGYGILNAATSIGIIVGSILTGIKVIKLSPLNIVLISIGMHGFLYGIFAFSNNLSVGFIILVLAGAISAPAMIYNRTLMQDIVPENIQGKVFTVISTAGTIGFPIGNFLAAMFLSVGGEDKVNLLFLLSGGFVFIFCLILLVVWLRRDQINGDLNYRVSEKN